MLDYLLTSFLVYKYWLFFGITFLASLGFPIPATALLLAGGAFIAQGYFDFSLLVAAGLTGCILGDMLGYTIARTYGKTLFVRIGIEKVFNSGLFRTFEPYFLRHAVITIFLTRFLITGLGPAINILSGLTRLRLRYFSLGAIIGEVIYILLYLSVGYSFASEWETILELIESFGTILLSLTLIAILLFLLRKYTKKSRKAL